MWRKLLGRRSSRTLWFVKDDPGDEWYCRCERGIVDAPHHDLQTWPTGGTGWLFTCTECGLAFMFARAEWIEEPLEDLAVRCTPRTRRLVNPKTGELTSKTLLATPRDWLALVQPLACGLIEGRRYVFLDGHVLPAEHGPVKFQGLWRDHDLPDLPHISEDESLQALIGRPEYWQRRDDQSNEP